MTDDKTCRLAHCENIARGRGYCSGHYQRFMAGQDMNRPLRPRNLYKGKVCQSPGCERTPRARGMCTTHYVSPKECSKDGCNRPHAAKGMCFYHYGKANDKGRKHGLTREERQQILELLGFKCNACGDPLPSLREARFDHDHTHCPGDQGCSKCVRGILCHACNIALGFLRDDIFRIAALQAYMTANPPRRNSFD